MYLVNGVLRKAEYLAQRGVQEGPCHQLGHASQHVAAAIRAKKARPKMRPRTPRSPRSPGSPASPRRATLLEQLMSCPKSSKREVRHGLEAVPEGVQLGHVETVPRVADLPAKA